MKTVVVVSGSPSSTSKTACVGDFIVGWTEQNEVSAKHIRLRDIPAEALLTGDFDDETLKAAVELVAHADGIILATPIFKGAYSGLMKAFLDILPQFGFKGKTLLLVGTGGSLAHVLSLDYGFRPVVQTMRPRTITQSLFIVEQELRVIDQTFEMTQQARTMLLDVLSEFSDSLRMSKSSAESCLSSSLRALA